MVIDWPSLTELFPASFPGVKTSRDAFLVDIDLDRLKGAQLTDYFNPELATRRLRRHPGVMKCGARLRSDSSTRRRSSSWRPD